MEKMLKKVIVICVAIIFFTFVVTGNSGRNCPDDQNYTFEFSRISNAQGASSDSIQLEYTFYFHKQTLLMLPDNITDALYIKDGRRKVPSVRKQEFTTEILNSEENPIKFKLNYHRDTVNKNSLVIEGLGGKVGGLNLVSIIFNPHDKCPAWFGPETYLVSAPFSYEAMLR